TGLWATWQSFPDKELIKAGFCRLALVQPKTDLAIQLPVCSGLAFSPVTYRVARASIGSNS
ncbi:MAG TPA: hypothetical protein DIC26_03100, partial [Pseudomonas sp.]|nr:hypothetical protein [Pseudomonas sp.]